MGRRILGALVWFSLAASSTIGGEWTPPSVATSRKAYEIAYPKKTVSSAALELERLAAVLGIDATPKAPEVVETVGGEEGERPPDRKDDRDRPDPMELAERLLPTISAVGRWVDQQLSEPSERIGPPPPAVERYFDENSATLDALAAVVAGPRPIEWDLDVALGMDMPLPNLLGLLRIQRVLAARALLQMRAGDPDSALVTMDGMWALIGSLAEQPFHMSQAIALVQVRLVVGLLRKVDGPAFGWERRLRDHAFYQAFLAGFQNDPWPAATDPDAAPTVETLTRIYRRFADGLIEKTPCEWTAASLEHSWDVAVSGENPPDEVMSWLMDVGASRFPESIMRTLQQWQRLLVDSELTELVLQARAEKAASREGEWPARLVDLESSVCPGRFYSYRRSGGVAISLEGRLRAEDREGLVLPLSFRGAPPPTPTPTPPAATPTPSARP